MADFSYKQRERNYDKFITPIEELIADEKRKNTYELKDKIITTKGTVIRTFGEIKKHLKTLKDIEKIEELLDDDDYIYLHNWLYFKLKGKVY